MLSRELLALAAGCLLLFAGPASAESFRLLKLDANYVKWDRPVAGTGAAVSYWFIRKRHEIPGARNCRSMEPIDLRSRERTFEYREIRREFQNAARQWMAVANVSFTPARSAGEADLLIGSQKIPRGKAFANVIPRRAKPESGRETALGASSGRSSPSYSGDANANPGKMQAIDKAMICLNPQIPWKVGFDGNTEIYDLQYTFLHELGHVLGLNHAGASGSIMAFRYSEAFDRLQPGDIQGAVRLYGPRTGL